MAKIWLVIHHPFRRGIMGSKIAHETRDRTFLTSIDVVRYARLLETQQKTMKWGWLFKSYFQWHAIAFLLAELCVRTTGPAVEDAWTVVEEAWPDWDKTSNSKKLVLWKPIARLMGRARAARKKELDKRSRLAQFPTDGTLGPKQSFSHADYPMAIHSADITPEMISKLPADTQQNDVSQETSPQTMPGSSTTDSSDMMDVSQPNATMLPAEPLTDMSTFNQPMGGLGQFLADPIMNSDPFLEGDMNWTGWDENLAMDFRNELNQPMDFNVDQLWGGP